MKNEAYEWVVLCKDKEFYLTEKQHEFLMANHQERFVTFKEFSIQPGMISYSYRRPAEVIKEYYPCKKCNTNGLLHERDKEGNLKVCPDCQGTGINL